MDGKTETQEVTTASTSEPQQVVKTSTTVAPPIKTEHPQTAYTKKKAIFRAYQIIWYILGVIEVLLAFRLVLKLLGANPASGFVSFIYSMSAPLILPFQGIFSSPASGGSVFELSTIIAALVYAVVAYGLVYLLQLIKPVTPHEVENKVDAP